jgi:hypothetical protein
MAGYKVMFALLLALLVVAPYAESGEWTFACKAYGLIAYEHPS